MRKSRFTEEQIAYALREVEHGAPAAELCRKMGVPEQTFLVYPPTNREQERAAAAPFR